MTIEDLLKETEIELEKGDIQSAIIYLETIFEIDEYNKRGLMLMCKVLSQIEAFVEALEYAEKAYKYYSDDLEVLFTMGYLNQELQKYKKSMIYYEKYTEKIKNYHVYLNMAISSMNLKHYKKSMNYIKKAIEMEPDNIDGFYELAELHLRTGKFETAMDIYENKIKNMSDTAEYYLYMKIAEAYYSIGNVEKAVENYNISINSDYIATPLVYEKFYELIMSEALWDEMELLIINYKNSGFPMKMALNMEGRYSVLVLKDYERSKRVSKQLIALEPDNYKNYINLIYAHENLKEFDEALETLEKVVKMVGKSKNLSKMRINIKSKQKRYLKKLEENNKK